MVDADAARYRIGVDTGGTFTDLVLGSPEGVVVATEKLPSTPSDPSGAVLAGIDALLAGYAARTGVRLERADVDVTHGSTVATNALIEMVQKRDAGVVFVTTAGFEDLLFLGRQHRPDLYALVPKRPAPPVLRERCVGVAERMGFDGAVIEPLTDTAVAHVVERVVGLKPSAVALCLLHAYVNAEHEARLADALRIALPSGVAVTVSSELIPVMREFERSAACVINAAVGPAMRGYLGRLSEALGGTEHADVDAGADRRGSLVVMGSHGGTMAVDEAIAEPIHTILSGPAGGVAGVRSCVDDAFEPGEAAKLITLDMGGTSTDVCLIDDAAGGATLGRDHEAAGLPVALPMVDVHAIGAGGGSIAWVDGGGALRVGPRSAGAEPGPAAYGKQAAGRASRSDALASDGWWPTVTDAHVVLGHLDPEAVLGGVALRPDDAEAAVAALACRLGVTTHQAAEGVLAIADAAMARAVGRVSLARGHDPREFALVAFGGAGGLHACRVAALLGMKRVLLPVSPGLMCAAGMLAAPQRRTAELSVSHWIRHEADSVAKDETSAKLVAVFDRLRDRTGFLKARDEERITVEARYADQTHALELDAGPILNEPDAHDRLRSMFDAEHARRFGWSREEQAIVWTTARCVSDRDSSVGIRVGEDQGRRGVYGCGDAFAGPTTIAEDSGTAVIPGGWRGRVGRGGTLVLDHDAEANDNADVSREAEASGVSAIELEVFRALFTAAAEEMGETLMRCASSPNITERLDHSCAVFDATGAMIAQAAHIPVHLGSAPASVRAVIDRFGCEAMRPGDRFLLNDPFAGGTHLPDVTVVRPVFLSGDALPSFFVAARAHHADVGGDEPGSMGLSTSIDQEGERLVPTRWTEDTVARFADGTRTPAERHTDLLAQAASVDAGATRLVELAKSHGRVRLLEAGRELLEHARRLTAATLDGLPNGSFAYEDVLDGDGIAVSSESRQPILIRCVMTVDEDRLPLFDFSGCDDQVSGPMNATRSIVESAVLYALRLACGAELPNNSGVLEAVRIKTRPGSVVDARPPAAVVGGNVETSQRLVDVVLGVLDRAMPDRLPADSCGSMNNVVIGSTAGKTDRASFAYYETLAGGVGAGPLEAGGDALHTHMTNTRNTPVEALESRFPLRITKYALRGGSGGDGRYSGGRGVIRSYRFLQPARLTLLLERRSRQPRGREGGGGGLIGDQRLSRSNGEVVQLRAKCAIDVHAGDTLEIETPGGAGWGCPEIAGP
ncbi:MAG: hydantoinase B/oxoprolinase family protein [Planctomycetota bacterium]